MYKFLLVLLFVLSLPITVIAGTDSDNERPEFYSSYYIPNTEELGSKEMRVTALGTGFPTPRKAQAGGSWFVELGNGDKFLFDVGRGSQTNFSMLQASYRDADKVFLSHLHVDHAGDLATIWIVGWTSGRFDRPLRVWGPSGKESRLGTRHFLEMLQQTWVWDLTSRHGKVPAAGAEIEINEFDYSKTHVVYDFNGVKITAFPAVHAIDGAVSYKLEWNGLSFAYSGDTSPNKFFVDNTKGVDLSVHETFITAKHLEERFGYDKKTSLIVAEIIHTSPEAGGKVFALTQPRMAVGYHFLNDFDTAPEIRDGIRKNYSGPLTMAEDGMVFNITKNDINVRLLLGPEHAWPEIKNSEKFGKAKRGKNTPMSDWLKRSMLFTPKMNREKEHSH